MSKIKRLKKRFTAFVNQLTPDQVREQLILSYLQMETCKNALKDYDVEPVEMMDNGESSDLELFYMCKKVREELNYLNQKESKPQGKRITIGVDVDYSEAIKQIKDFKKEFEKLQVGANKFLRPDVYVMKVDLKKYFEPIHFDTADDMSMLEFHRIMCDYFSLLDHRPKEFYLLKRKNHE
jgi:hypothetical protein